MKTVIILSYVLFGLVGSLFAQPQYPTNPAEAKYVLSDVKLFIDVFKRLDQNSDTVENSSD